MQERRAQGCEDFKLYLKISERYEFAVIKEHLTGLRQLRDAMSMDLLRMLRSYELVAEYAEREHPCHVRAIRAGRTDNRRMLLAKAVRSRRLRSAIVLAVELARPISLARLEAPFEGAHFRDPILSAPLESAAK